MDVDNIVETIKDNKVLFGVVGLGAVLLLIFRGKGEPQTVNRTILLQSGDTFAGAGTSNVPSRIIRPPYPGPGPQPGPNPEPMPLPNPEPEPSPIPIGRRLPPGGNTENTSFGVLSREAQKFRLAQASAKNYVI